MTFATFTKLRDCITNPSLISISCERISTLAPGSGQNADQHPRNMNYKDGSVSRRVNPRNSRDIFTKLISVRV